MPDMPVVETKLEPPTPTAAPPFTGSETAQVLESTTPEPTPNPSDPSPTAYFPSQRVMGTHPSQHEPLSAQTSANSALSRPLSSTSPSTRHPLTRPLSPDLPVRDALYVFSNFSSYMRSPHEGADGIHSSADFWDTIRLLDYARSNVHVLHVKYRFQGQTGLRGSAHFNAKGEYHQPKDHRDLTGRLRNPVPQPFSTLHDPVIKLDYCENGTFEPLPAQAIYTHIAKCCQPPPRVIVYSYVASQVTQNHLSSLSTWALASSPPAYIFSPLETRIRERAPLHQALHHAVPMSMYAWPADGPGTIPLSLPLANNQAHVSAPHSLVASHPTQRRRRLSAPSGPVDLQDMAEMGRSPDKIYPPDPVASLTVTADTPSPPSDGPPPLDRIPLWALVPGVGALQGSIASSIGISLSAFSAINISGQSSTKDRQDAERRRRVSLAHPRSGTLAGHPTTLAKSDTKTGNTKNTEDDTAPAGQNLSAPPLEAPSRPITPSRALDTTTVKSSSNLLRKATTKNETHLSPPDIPPIRRAGTSAPRTLSATSWPAPVNRVPGWKRGRKEQMEDVLESVLGQDPSEEVICKVEALKIGPQAETIPSARVTNA